MPRGFRLNHKRWGGWFECRICEIDGLGNSGQFKMGREWGSSYLSVQFTGMNGRSISRGQGQKWAYLTTETASGNSIWLTSDGGSFEHLVCTNKCSSSERVRTRLCNTITSRKLYYHRYGNLRSVNAASVIWSPDSPSCRYRSEYTIRIINWVLHTTVSTNQWMRQFQIIYRLGAHS